MGPVLHGNLRELRRASGRSAPGRLPPRRTGVRGWLGPLAAVLVLVIGILSAVVFFHRARPHLITYSAAVLADHPVAFWNVQASGARERDLTGHGHTGTYKGGSPVHARMPNGDNAANFNGAGQYLSVPSSAAFSISTTGELTWEAWIKPQTLQWSNASDPFSLGYVNWMGKCQRYSPSCEWGARMYASVNREGRCNRLSAYVFNPSAGNGGGADWQPNCNLLAAGQWLYVVGEYQTRSTPSRCSSSYPGTINIWVNGIERHFSPRATGGCMSQDAVTPQAGGSPLNIGTMALDNWFQGAVGKVAIYDKLLSQAQISTHYTAMTGAQPFGDCSASTCSIPVPTP